MLGNLDSNVWARKVVMVLCGVSTSKLSSGVVLAGGYARKRSAYCRTDRLHTMEASVVA